MVFHLSRESLFSSISGASCVPTYDYKCDACDHLWEEFQSIKADPIKKCPSCGKSKARRQIGGGAGLIFKGSGFYLTDYRSDSYKKAAEADKKASSGGDSAPKSDGGSAPKPESGKKNSDKS
jgi:putative FmdB family regulatory protein